MADMFFYQATIAANQRDAAHTALGNISGDWADLFDIPLVAKGETDDRATPTHYSCHIALTTRKLAILKAALQRLGTLTDAREENIRRSFFEVERPAEREQRWHDGNNLMRKDRVGR